jgi:uncharacterized protein DUF2510
MSWVPRPVGRPGPPVRFVAGWYPDPTERFGQRYHDGHRWTEHARDQSGEPRFDPEGAAVASTMWVAPPVMGPPPPPRVAGPSWTPTVGMLVAAVGAALILLVSWLPFDFLALDGASSSMADIVGWTFDDMTDQIFEDLDGDGRIDDSDVLPDRDVPKALSTYAWFALGGTWLLVCACGVMIGMSALPNLKRGSGATVLTVVAAVVCGLCALWVVAAVASFPGDVGPGIGAILAVVGYLAIAVGAFVRAPLTGRS